jgi:hypothetical protein
MHIAVSKRPNGSSWNWTVLWIKSLNFPNAGPSTYMAREDIVCIDFHFLSSIESRRMRLESWRVNMGDAGPVTGEKEVRNNFGSLNRESHG